MAVMASWASRERRPYRTCVLDDWRTLYCVINLHFVLVTEANHENNQLVL